MKWLFSTYKDTGFTYYVILGMKFRVFRKRAKRNVESLFNVLGNTAIDDVSKILPLLALSSREIELLSKLAKACALPKINRDELQSKVANMQEFGLCASPRSPRVIVSLTSYPKRLYDIHLCLYSLLSQDLKPDKVVLWLAEDEFPNRESDIPQEVTRLKKFGLEIMWVPGNIKSYKKLLPALQAFPDDVIVTADDDIYYPQNWLRSLYEAHSENPENVIAHRVKTLKIADGKPAPYWKWDISINHAAKGDLQVPTGCGGILYPPRAFTPEVFNIAKIEECAPHADDLWFWFMRVLADTGFSCVKNQPYTNPIYINPEREIGLNEDGTLFEHNIQGENDAQLQRIIGAYPAVWQKVLDLC